MDKMNKQYISCETYAPRYCIHISIANMVSISRTLGSTEFRSNKGEYGVVSQRFGMIEKGTNGRINNMPDIYHLQRIQPRKYCRRERSDQVVVAQIQRSHAARRWRPRSIRRQQARGRPTLHAPPQTHAARRVRMVERQPARRAAPSGARVGRAAAGR